MAQNFGALKSFVTALALFVGITCTTSCKVSDEHWSSLKEIRQLSLSIALTDFPVPQGKLRDVVGLPKHAPPLWGSSWRKGGTFCIAALTDPESKNGYFALRIVYKDYSAGTLPKPEEIEVLSLEVLFVAPNQMTFVEEARDTLVKMLPGLKSQMLKDGMKPREFAARFYSFEDEKSTDEMDSKPNSIGDK